MVKAPPSSVLDVSALRAGYGRGKTVLHDVDLHVAHGELALLMGHNGAGKSTLLRTIFGELQQTQGEVRFLGETLRGSSP